MAGSRWVLIFWLRTSVPSRLSTRLWPGKTAIITPGGFQPENALSRRQALLGMTRWVARGSFEENEKGSLEKGKSADFILLGADLMKCKIDDVLSARVGATYIEGEQVYFAGEK